MSLFLKVVFSFFWFAASTTISYAQTEFYKPACVLELGELSPDMPGALVSFNLASPLKILLIDLTRLRIRLAQGSDETYLSNHYLNELKKLKEIFLAQGYSDAFFSDTHAFFFHELSQRNGTFEQTIETKTSLAQKQKDALYPLRGRTRQVINAIVKELGIPEEDITTEDLKSITELNLNNQKITELREHDFNGLINLKTLELANNQLTGLPQNVFQGLESLKWLLLCNNQLTGLPQNVFRGLESLKWLSLSKNPISVISESVFSAPGLNQNLKITLYDLSLDKDTKRILIKKYKKRIEAEF